MTKEERAIYKPIFNEIDKILKAYKKYEKRIEYLTETYIKPEIINKQNLEKISGSGYVEFKSEIEKLEEIKERVSKDIFRCEEGLYRIDSALEMVKDHKGYEVIELLYFKGMTYEKAAEELGVSSQTVRDKKDSIFMLLIFHLRIQKLLIF